MKREEKKRTLVPFFPIPHRCSAFCSLPIRLSCYFEEGMVSSLNKGHSSEKLPLESCLCDSRRWTVNDSFTKWFQLCRWHCIVNVLLGYSTAILIFDPPVLGFVNVEVAGVEVATGTEGVRKVDNTTVGNPVIIGSAEITPPVSIVGAIVVVGAIRVCSFSLKRRHFAVELNRFLLGSCSTLSGDLCSLFVLK